MLCNFAGNYNYNAIIESTVGRPRNCFSKTRYFMRASPLRWISTAQLLTFKKSNTVLKTFSISHNRLLWILWHSAFYYLLFSSLLFIRSVLLMTTMGLQGTWRCCWRISVCTDIRKNFAQVIPKWQVIMQEQ